jgi:hypothetical protein
MVNYADLDDEALIGKDFWDMVGGVSTYEEVSEIFRRLAKKKTRTC